MKTLQEQYNQIKEGKGHKGIFLNEAKKKFPNMLTNPMGFEETTKILKNRGVINENYIDLQPVNSYESPAKEPWENKFDSFLKEQEEKIKAEAKKTDKSVEELADKNYDYKDYKNLDNQIGQEVMNGVYFEAKQNPDKSIDEIKDIVSKNLNKDSEYYVKNAAFGVEGLGYEEQKTQEVSGKHKSSGYSDKLKDMVKETLLKENLNEVDEESIEKTKELTQAVKDLDQAKEEAGIEEDHSKDPNDKYVVKPCESPGKPFAVWEGDIKVKEFSSKEEAQSYADKQNEEQGLDEESKPVKEKKKKKQTTDDKLAEIDKQAEIVALEAKLSALSEIIESKEQRISMVSEDENLSELVDKKRIKEMQKEIKVLEKRKAKMERIYEKKAGKSYQQEEIIDESTEEDNE